MPTTLPRSALSSFCFGQVGQLHLGRHWHRRAPRGRRDRPASSPMSSASRSTASASAISQAITRISRCAGSDDGPQPLGDSAGLPRPVHQSDPARAVLRGIFAELQSDVACTAGDQHMPARQRRRVRRRTGVAESFRVQTAVAQRQFRLVGGVQRRDDRRGRFRACACSGDRSRWRKASVRVFATDATESGADRGGNRMLAAVRRDHCLAADGDQPVLLHRAPGVNHQCRSAKKLVTCRAASAWLIPSIRAAAPTRDSMSSTTSSESAISRADSSWLSACAHSAAARSSRIAGVIDEAEAPWRQPSSAGSAGSIPRR